MGGWTASTTEIGVPTSGLVGRPTWAGLEVDDFMRRLPGLTPQLVLEIQNQVLELIACNASLDVTLSAISRFAERCIPGMMASVLYYDPAVGALKRGGYGSMPSSFVDIVDGLVPGPSMGSCGTAAFLQKRIISEDVETDPLWANFLELCHNYNIRSAWSSPLVSGRDSSLLGVFGMYHPTVRKPSDDELAVVDHFTHLASIAAERHRVDTEQSHRASHDAVTEVGNRHQLSQEGPRVLAQRRASGGPLTLVFIDLDRFKSFNDVFGHVAGDVLLRKVSNRLNTGLAPHDLLVRFGGDEFIAFLPLTVEDSLARLAHVRELLRTSVDIAETRAQVSFSAGLIECIGSDATLDALIFAVDEAARNAKDLGGDRDVVADAVQSAEVQRKRSLSLDLADALERGRVDPHMQPIVRIEDGFPQSFELLFRLNDPRFFGVPIPEIIRISEESGLIHRIGVEMIRAACRILAESPADFAGITINVNVSVHQLMRSEFVAQCAEALADYHIEAGQLCVELTESRLLDSAGPARDTLLALKDMGFRLALDDFGTGYASLTYLQSLPVDYIKVDKSFVDQVEHAGRNRSLCTALLSMGRACVTGIVAEGVETEEQARALLELGYPLGQGFLWSRPMHAIAARRWMREARARAA